MRGVANENMKESYRQYGTRERCGGVCTQEKTHRTRHQTFENTTPSRSARTCSGTPAQPSPTFNHATTLDPVGRSPIVLVRLSSGSDTGWVPNQPLLLRRRRTPRGHVDRVVPAREFDCAQRFRLGLGLRLRLGPGLGLRLRSATHCSEIEQVGVSIYGNLRERVIVDSL